MPRASGQIRGRATTTALSALTAALLAPAAAFGSSGEITRALANANWTLGDIAAEVSWDDCVGQAASSDCAWIPYMTIGPGASRSECESPERDWPGLGEGIALAFGGGGFKGTGPFSYESPAISLRGRPEQLACLLAIERTPAIGASHSLRLDAAMLEAPPPVAETEEPATEVEPSAMEEEEPQGEESAESPPAEGESPQVEEPLISPEQPVKPLVEDELPILIEEPPRPPSGEITRALANADRTRGSIAGSFTWDGCARTIGAPTSYCAWIPYATIGPGPPSECASPERDWSSLGEDVSLVLWGGETIGAGTHEFDFPDIWIDRSSRLLCLAVAEVTQTDTYSHRLAAAPLTTPPVVSDAKVVAEN
jgi:hypothetical protein